MGRIMLVKEKQMWGECLWTREGFKAEFDGRNPEQYGYQLKEDTVMGTKGKYIIAYDGIPGKFRRVAEQHVVVGFHHSLDRGIFPVSEAQGLLGYNARSAESISSLDWNATLVNSCSFDEKTGQVKVPHKSLSKPKSSRQKDDPRALMRQVPHKPPSIGTPNHPLQLSF